MCYLGLHLHSRPLPIKSIVNHVVANRNVSNHTFYFFLQLQYQVQHAGMYVCTWMRMMLYAVA
jgi:hypothetical protein